MNDLSGFIRGVLSDTTTGFSIKSLPGFFFAFLTCAVLAHLLAKIYVRFGRGLSNRRNFASNFLLMALTTMFIISIVKSSLALSLGLVGALSIVRFRSAIKEPEELIYLFVTIAIGLGCGAGLPLLTILAFGGFAFFIWLNNKERKAYEGETVYLTIAAEKTFDLDRVNDELKGHCTAVKVKRIDQAGEAMEASYFVDFEHFDKLNSLLASLREKFPTATISYMDNSRDF